MLHAVRRMWQLATHSNHPIRGKQYCEQVAIKLKYDKISFHYEMLSCVIRFSFIATSCTLYNSIYSKRERVINQLRVVLDEQMASVYK